MERLNVYFDYVCPYCYRGVMDLLELLPAYPQLSVKWIPCEAHPRPEWAFMHSDLASQVMLALEEQGCDLICFHKEIFNAHFVEHHRIDSPTVLADIGTRCGADRDKILTAIKDGTYAQAVADNDRLVWDRLGFEAVPCYQSGRKLLASQEDVMISQRQLKAFLDAVMTG